MVFIMYVSSGCARTYHDIFDVYASPPRDTNEDADSLGDASSQPDTVSIASRTSQNTADSDKVETDYTTQQPPLFTQKEPKSDLFYVYIHSYRDSKSF